jgi:putative ABC transport system substrate-binding protein
MLTKIFVPLLAALALASIHLAQAQQIKMYRVGVIHEGGTFYAVVDGLKDGLRELGLEEGTHYVLEIRDLKGDRKAAEEAARSLERGKINLIYVVSTSPTTVVKRATAEVPIVFAVGSDPVVSGLVESFAKPGGRLTGVHFLSADLTGKRLEILKEMLPGLRKVVTRRVRGRSQTWSGGAQEADAYFYTNDAMVVSQAQSIIDTARAKKLPTMFNESGLVAQGALVSYGVSYHEIGRLSAKYVQRVLAGTGPRNLPVESLSRLELAINLKTARELGLAIPQSVLFRADKVVE